MLARTCFGRDHGYMIRFYNGVKLPHAIPQRALLKPENMTRSERVKYNRVLRPKPGIRPLSTFHPGHPIHNPDGIFHEAYRLRDRRRWE